MARRRVVTGHDAGGRSIMLSDGPAPGRLASGEWDEVWVFPGVPASLADPTDFADAQTFRVVPLPGGIACRIASLPGIPAPTNAEWKDGIDEWTAANGEWERRIDLAETELASGTGALFTELIPGTGDLFWHRTPTVDLIVLISGEMDLLLDGGETVHLGPGDSVVQRGTRHAWRNFGTEPCLFAAFMVRAE